MENRKLGIFPCRTGRRRNVRLSQEKASFGSRFPPYGFHPKAGKSTGQDGGAVCVVASAELAPQDSEPQRGRTENIYVHGEQTVNRLSHRSGRDFDRIWITGKKEAKCFIALVMTTLEPCFRIRRANGMVNRSQA